MVVEIGNSRTVTCRVQPPLATRLCDNEKEYLNGFTVPLPEGAAATWDDRQPGGSQAP